MPFMFSMSNESNTIVYDASKVICIIAMFFAIIITPSATVCRMVYLYRTVLWIFCRPLMLNTLFGSPDAIGLLCSTSYRRSKYMDN